MVTDKMSNENATISLIARTTMFSSVQAAMDKVDNNILWKDMFQTRVENWFEMENYYFPDGIIV